MDITIGETTYEQIWTGSDTMIQDPGVGQEVTPISSEAGYLIAKAGWNYLLLHGDGSHGIHSPTFALDIVEATLAALE